MPVEIREIIIKTEITTGRRNSSTGSRDKELNLIKKQLLEEFKRMITLTTKRSSYKR